MTLTIHTGRNQPLRAVGKNQCNLLDFAYRFPGWHTFREDRATKNAVKALVAKNVLETYNMFRLKTG